MFTPSIPVVFQTRFAMFVPCDWPTYKRLKRVRHLAAFAQAMACRWSRAQRRLPHNRYFRKNRRRIVVTDAMLFGPFWTPVENPGGSRSAVPTPLLAAFMGDYRNARTPVVERSLVKPLTLDADELARLWLELESWYVRVFLKW